MPLVDTEAGRRAVVKHRVGQKLEDEPHLPALMGQQGQCGREPAARTRPTDGDAVRIHVRSAGQPGERVVAIVKGGWKRMIRCQSVVDGGNDDPELPGEMTAHCVVLRCGAEHVAAAVDPEQRRHGMAGRCGPVHPHRGGGHRLHLNGLRRPFGLQPGEQPDRIQGPSTDRGTRQPAGNTTKIRVEVIDRHQRDGPFPSILRSIFLTSLKVGDGEPGVSRRSGTVRPRL
jgi:hypothetical protein